MADASPKFRDGAEFREAAAEFRPEVTVPADKGLRYWQFMVAGSIAGCAEHTAMFPVDTLKTRMQARSSCAPQYPAALGLRQALGSVLKIEGPVGLYRGIAAMSLGAGPAHAVYFSVYEVSKKLLCGGNPNNHAAHALSGVLATVSSDAVFTPMDMVKQRLQLRSSPYKGVWDCVRRVLREEGFRAFYASYRTTVVMNAPFTAIHFTTYEAAKKGLSELFQERDREEEGFVVHATAGAIAGALAAALTTPFDVVKTRLQCQGVCGCDRYTNSSIKDIFGTIVRKDGYAGLMMGWKPRMLFHAPAAAICWTSYEASKTFFENLNESHRSA